MFLAMIGMQVSAYSFPLPRPSDSRPDSIRGFVNASTLDQHGDSGRIMDIQR